MSDIQITIRTDAADSGVVIQRVTDAVKGLGTATKDTTAQNQKLNTSLPAVTSTLSETAMTAVKAGAAFAGVALSIKGIWNAAEAASKRSEVKQGFVELTRSVGLSADEITSKIKKVTAETVSNSETMKAVSKTITLGIVANADEMAKLMEIARSKSRGLNQSTIETYDQLVAAINTGTQKALKSLGIDLPEAIEKSTEKMDDAEKKAVILGAVLEQEGAKITKLGGVHDSAADKFRRFDVAVGSIKGSLTSLALELTPVIELVARLTAAMANFINVRDRYAAMSMAELKKAKADTETLLNGEIALNESQAAERARFNNMRSDDPNFTGGAGTYQTSQREIELKDTLSAIDKHISARAELDKTREKYLQTVKAGTAADNAAVKSTKEHTAKSKEQKEEYVSLLKAVSEAYKEAKEFAQSDDLEKVKIIFQELEQSALGFADALGAGRLAPVRDTLLDLAEIAGTIAGNLSGSDPAKYLYGGAKTTVTGAYDWAKNGLQQTFGGIAGFGKTFIDAVNNTEIKPATVDTLKVSVRDAVEQGFNEALTSGDISIDSFMASFGSALKRQVFSAMSTSVTNSIFNSSGSSIFGYMGGSNTIYSGGNGVASGIASGAGGSASAGGSLLGNLFNVGPLWKNGALQTGNLTQLLGTNLVAGFAINKLFGQGGLFGSSVVHGAERIQQSADINTQVTQSKELRDDLLKSLGIDEETRKALADAQFFYTWYEKHKSGNGITSKKTTTYELYGQGAAYDSINRVKLLSEQVEAEQAYRSFDLAKLSNLGGLKALQEQLKDIDSVVAHLNDYKPGSTTDYLYSDTDRAQLLTQQMQAQSQLYTARGAGTNNAAGYLFGDINTAALAGLQSGIGTAGKARNLLEIALGNSDMPDDPAMIAMMMPILKTSAAESFSLQREAANAGNDPAKIAAVLQRQKSALERAMSTYATIMQDAEAEAASTTLSIEERRAAFERFQQAQTAYYSAKQQALDIEIQQEQAVKEKQQKLRDDQLGSLLSWVGEIGGRNGNTYNIFNNTQTLTLLQQLKAANAGKNPELTALLDAMIAQNSQKTKWG